MKLSYLKPIIYVIFMCFFSAQAIAEIGTLGNLYKQCAPNRLYLKTGQIPSDQNLLNDMFYCQGFLNSWALAGRRACFVRDYVRTNLEAKNVIIYYMIDESTVSAFNIGYNQLLIAFSNYAEQNPQKWDIDAMIEGMNFLGDFPCPKKD